MSSHNIIGVAGGTAAGKTTIVSKLYDHYGKNTCVIIGQDAYYKDHNNLNFKQRILINYDHPNSIDIDLFHENLVSLKNGQQINKPTYDHKTHTRNTSFESISPKKLIFVEGTLVLHFKRLVNLMLKKIFIYAPEKIRFDRRVARDMSERGRSIDSVLKQYKETVYPMHKKFVEPSKSIADINISGQNKTEKSVQKIITSIDSLLLKRK